VRPADMGGRATRADVPAAASSSASSASAPVVGIWLHSLAYSFPHFAEMPTFETALPAFARPGFALAERGGPLA